MMLAANHLVQTGQLSQGISRAGNYGFLASQASGIPIKVHLLPLNQVAENVLDRPPATGRYLHAPTGYHCLIDPGPRRIPECAQT